MAIRCIDISDDKRLSSVSPIAMFVFVGYFIGLSAWMRPSILYFILLVIGWVVSQIFFQYKTRYVFLMIKFLMTCSYLTPSFEDEECVLDESKLKNLKKILPLDDEDEG